MEMVVGGKYMTTCLGKLDLLGGNSNIGHHVLKKLDNNVRYGLQISTPQCSGWVTHAIGERRWPVGEVEIRWKEKI